ncbi:MAG: FAD-dependent oxidoreductase [Lachnospiraceae bacterium]
MSEEKFDVIVVGAGLAGNTAAYLMAKAGLEVLVIERGETIGCKNVTGGRMYSHSIEKIFPDFAKEAPVERKITKERISFVTGDSATTIEYAADKLGEQGKATYSICRGHFDPWLAGKAEEAGAMYVTGIRVDEVLLRDGKVCGVIAGGEEMEADMVLLADGVNSLLAQQLGMKKELDPSQVAVGVKEIIRLGEEKINDRFGAASNEEGTAWLFAGDVCGGNVGGGFIYTNKDSLSVGIVTTISEIGRIDLAPRDMLERLKAHPTVAPLLKGGETIEYAAHLVTEGGYDMIPTLYRDNVLVAGDAAALVMNLGFTIRGMDLVIESGRLAAETIIAAKQKGDYSAATLSQYKTALDNSFVMKDMQHFRKMPKFIENHRIHGQYPQMIDEIMSELFIMYGQEPVKFKKKAMKSVKKVGMMNLLKDGMNGMGAM